MCRGRTFDEIREEHRRRNSAQYGRPSNTETKSSGELSGCGLPSSAAMGPPLLLSKLIISLP